MNILLIGGTNFIGPFVVRRLVERGHSVTVFHRGQTQAELPDMVRHIYGDRRNLLNYQSVFSEVAPNVVVDMIPASQQDAINVVKTFEDMAHRVVCISSMDVYRAYDRIRKVDSGPSDPVPLTEEGPLRNQLYPYRPDADSPDDLAYSYDKILVEREMMGSSRLPGTVLRLPAVYGPGDYQRRLGLYLQYIDDQRPAILMDEGMMQWRRTRGYVDNVAEAIVLATTLESAANRVYNVGDEPALTEEEWVKNIARLTGWNGRIIGLPSGQLPAHRQQNLNFSQDWVLDTTRVRNELNYNEIVSLDEAIRRTVAWERDNPDKSQMRKSEEYAAEDTVLMQL